MINNVKTFDGYVAIYFKIRGLTRDCWCYGSFYKELGLLDWFREHPEMSDVKNIFMNDTTSQQVKKVIRDRYSLVNLKKDKYGSYKVSLYRVRKKKLSQGDELTLGMDYLNYSPTINDDLPNGVIVFKYNKDVCIDIAKIWGV